MFCFVLRAYIRNLPGTKLLLFYVKRATKWKKVKEWTKKNRILGRFDSQKVHFSTILFCYYEKIAYDNAPAV